MYCCSCFIFLSSNLLVLQVHMTLSFRNAFSNYFEAYEVAFYPASIASIKQILIQGHPKTHFAGAPAQRKSQVDTPAPGVCHSLFPRGNVLKAEIVRLVAGLGVLKQQTSVVESLVHDDDHAAIGAHVQQLFVSGVDGFHCDEALAGDNLHTQCVLNIIVDRACSNFRCQAGDKLL